MNRALVLLLTLIINTQVIAMGKSPEPYTPLQWHDNANAAEDAAYALKNDDKRLLAYYGRDVVVPGIKSEEKKLLSDKCGLRMMEGFGDVVRSDAHLEKMKTMRAYAERYNQVVAPQCLEAEVDSE